MRAFKTGHELFDVISNLKSGSLITILDETYSESLDFLNALLSKHKSLPVYVLAPNEVETPFEIKKIDVTKSLNDINLTVASVREKIKKGVIIHRYLPYILLKENENAFLRMLNYWSSKIAGTKIVEFFLLPQGTFLPFEKKLQAVTDGVIVIRVGKDEEGYRPIFSIVRGSKPAYHFVEFPCAIDQGRLLIKWGDRYRFRAPKNLREKLDMHLAKPEKPEKPEKKKPFREELVVNPYCI